jgi:nitroreductase
MFSHSVSMMALGFTALFSIFGSATAQTSRPIVLPAPQISGGKPLMQALSERKTSREFDSRALSDQMLSNLLWAACGINRPESGMRTAPTAVNWQEIDIYVAMEKGLFLYEAKTNRLVPVLDKDIRANTGVQPFIMGAPVNLVFVADFTRMGGADTAAKEFYSATDTGFISQNVYLFCASEGLATVVRGLVDRKALAEVMKLGPDQKIVLAQTVGYPK